MIKKNLDGFIVFEFEKIQGDPGISCFVTTKKGPESEPFDLSKENLAGNSGQVKRFLKIFGGANWFWMRQAHTANVFVKKDAAPGFADACDAVCSNVKGPAFVGFSADCSLSLFYDKKNSAMAVCHAGWRGALLNIYSSVFRSMALNFGTKPADLFVGVAPFIAVSDYEVGKELIEKFTSVYGADAGRFYQEEKGRFFLNLESVLEFQLSELGINNYEFSGFSTFREKELFYSHRRGETGRFALTAVLKG